MYFTQANDVAREMRDIGFTRVYVRHITRCFHPDTWVEAVDSSGDLVVVKRYEDWLERRPSTVGGDAAKA